MGNATLRAVHFLGNRSMSLNHPVARSSFVSVLAWVFIAFSGLATFIAVAQNVMLALMLPPGAMDQAMASGTELPVLAQFMMSNPRLLFVLFLVVSASTLVASIGLLWRHNWARLFFIGLMVLGALWNLASLVMVFVMLQSFGIAPGDVFHLHDGMMAVMVVFQVVMVLALVALFAWIVRRLMSEAVRLEFQARR